ASYHILSTPAAPAPAAIPSIAIDPRNGSRCPGAIINPTSAVKTASNMTRGFNSVRKPHKRVLEVSGMSNNLALSVRADRNGLNQLEIGPPRDCEVRRLNNREPRRQSDRDGWEADAKREREG